VQKTIHVLSSIHYIAASIRPSAFARRAAAPRGAALISCVLYYFLLAWAWVDGPAKTHVL